MSGLEPYLACEIRIYHNTPLLNPTQFVESPIVSLLTCKLDLQHICIHHLLQFLDTRYASATILPDPPEIYQDLIRPPARIQLS